MNKKKNEIDISDSRFQDRTLMCKIRNILWYNTQFYSRNLYYLYKWLCFSKGSIVTIHCVARESVLIRICKTQLTYQISSIEMIMVSNINCIPQRAQKFSE